MRTLPRSPQYGLCRAGAASLLAALALAALTLGAAACAPRTRVLPPPGAADPVAGPVHRVLFIHGYRGETWYWDRFWLAALRFLPANCEAYIVTGLPGLMGATSEEGPEEPLATLEAWLAAQAIPLENLHLVAHSMGGLLARRFVTAHPGAVRQVFLLGVPSGGVNMLGALNPGGWCTPGGIGAFNAANSPDPRVQWFVLAGNRFRDGSGGALTEPYPNDGVVSVTSVLEFVRLCGDSVAVDWTAMPLTHPTWNWGENLLESKRAITWVIERLRADIEAAGAAPPAAPVANEPPAAP
jgi:pimeloyl-ACP methyl ester carboxylesterase